MRAAIVLTCAVFLTNCGGLDWDGDFTGVVTTTGTCSDGSPVQAAPENITMTLTQEDDTVEWHAPCGATAIADIDDNVARVRQYTCPASSSGGVTTTISVTGGTLKLDDSALDLNMSVHWAIAGALNGTCDGSAIGTLARDDE